jgi:hypothetical protein
MPGQNKQNEAGALNFSLNLLLEECPGHKLTIREDREALTNSVYLPRCKHPGQTQAHPRQINLVGLNRREGSAYGDCKAGPPKVNRLACHRAPG